MGSKRRRHREKLKNRELDREDSNEPQPVPPPPERERKQVRVRGAHVGSEARNVTLMYCEFEGVDQLAVVEGQGVMFFGSKATSPFVEGRSMASDKPESPMFDIADSAKNGVYARNLSIGGSGQIARDAGTGSQFVDNIAVSDSAVRDLGVTLLSELARLRESGVTVPAETDAMATELAQTTDPARRRSIAISLLPRLADFAQLASLALQIKQAMGTS